MNFLFLSKLIPNLFLYKTYNDIFIKYFLFKVIINLKLEQKFEDDN